MSGPKTARYRLTAEARSRARAEEMRRRQDRLEKIMTATDECDRLMHECDALKTAITSLKKQYPSESFDIDVNYGPRPQSNDLEGLIKHAEQMANGLARAKEQLAPLVAQAGANANFRSAIHSLIDKGGTVQFISEMAAAVSSPVPPTQDDVSIRRKELSDVLEHLQAPVGMLPDLQSLLSEYIGTSSRQRMRAIKDELHFQVKALNAKWQKQQNDQIQAGALIAALDEAGERENSFIRSSLQDVLCGSPLSPSLVISAKQAIEQCRISETEENTREAARVVHDALVELGYLVEPIQDTLFVEGGVVHFQKAEWGEYFVRLRVRPESQELNFNVVKTTHDPSTHASDLEAETRWCGDLPNLMATLEQKGIRTELFRQHKAGSVPMQSIADQDISIASHSKHKPSEKLRERKQPSP